jgi:hypothetical protein
MYGNTHIPALSEPASGLHCRLVEYEFCTECVTLGNAGHLPQRAGAGLKLSRSGLTVPGSLSQASPPKCQGWLSYALESDVVVHVHNGDCQCGDDPDEPTAHLVVDHGAPNWCAHRSQPIHYALERLCGRLRRCWPYCRRSWRTSRHCLRAPRLSATWPEHS